MYLKRTFKYIDSGLLTAVGEDLQSEQMVETFAREQLNNSNVLRHPKLIPGLYWIHNDEVDEKVFSFSLVCLWPFCQKKIKPSFLIC